MRVAIEIRMAELKRRIEKLEQQSSMEAEEETLHLLTVMRLDQEQVLDAGECRAILEDAGRLPRKGMHVLDLQDIPPDLTRAEVEHFLRTSPLFALEAKSQ